MLERVAPHRIRGQAAMNLKTGEKSVKFGKSFILSVPWILNRRWVGEAEHGHL